MQINADLVEDLVEQAKKRLKMRQNGVPKKTSEKGTMQQKQSCLKTQ